MTPLDQRFDAAIVGAGPAGAALAIALARAGFGVLLLERSRRCDALDNRKTLRGEWIAPWGVGHLRALGLYDLLAPHGQVIARHVRYDQERLGEAPQEDLLDLSGLVAGVPGPLGIDYGRLRQALVDEAVRLGVRLIDGTHLDDVRTGALRFSQNGREHVVRARAIIGADGRSSTLRKRLGIPLRTAPLHHYICGLLMADVEGWPADVELNVVGETTALMVNGVGGKRFRTYLYFDPERFKEIGQQLLADVYRAALRMEGVPGIEAIAAGRPVGACLGMPNAPTWTDRPYRDGIVLIGDAAGSDDPITGQGLSAAFEDVKSIAGILADAKDWTRPDLFAAHATSKAEILRRLRFTSIAFSIRDAEFDSAARRRRQEVRERLAREPACGLGLLSQYIGPTRLPPSAFTGAAWDRIFAGAVPPPDFVLSEPSIAHAESLCV